MDTLKILYSNISSCTIKQDKIELNGVLIDGTQIISFPSPKSKDYNLKSIVVFLQNSDLSLKDYVKICRQIDVTPVSHVDKSSIIQEIESFEAKKVDGFFIWPEYEDEKFCNNRYNGLKKYSIPSIKDKNIIIVPYSLTSKIHIDNVSCLLTSGKFENSSADPLSSNIRSLCIKGKDFIITNDVSSFNYENWESVKAMFIDGSDAIDLSDFKNKVPSDATIFSTKDEKFKSFKLDIAQGQLKNYDQVIQKILN